MGINADKYLVMNDLASFGECYLRVRNFVSTKEVDIHKFKYDVEVLVNGLVITTNSFVMPNVKTTITENNWKVAYDHLKQYLTSKNITFTDSM